MSRLLSEGAWATGGQIGSALGTLVGVRLLTEVMEPAQYGALSLVLGILALSSGLAIFPFSQGFLRFFPEWTQRNQIGFDGTFRSVLIASNSIAAAVLLVVWLLIAWIGPADAWVGLLLIPLVSSDALRGYYVTEWSARRQQAKLALFLATEAWVRPAFGVAAAISVGPQAAPVLGGFLVGSFAVAAIFFLPAANANLATRNGKADREVTGSPSECSSAAHAIKRKLVTFSLPLMPLAAFGWISGLFDRYLIGAFAGLHDAGLYAAVYGLVSRPFLMAGTALELTLRQPFYEAVTAGELVRARQIFKTWRGAAFVAGAAGLALFFVGHGMIADLLLGESYRSSSWLMGCIALGYCFLLVAQVYERACYAMHRTKAVALTEGTGAVLSVVLGVPLILSFGLVGAAIAVPAYFAFQLLAAVVFAQKQAREIGIL